MSLRKLARRALGKVSPAPALLIGGLGRCGTTLVFDSILESTYSYSRARQFVIDIASFDFEKSHVYKTHDFPPEALPSHVRPIFMFGNPMDAAVSASGFGEQHYIHIRSPHFPNRHKVFEEDVLLLESHFDSWMRTQNFEFASVRYENLYDAEVLAGLGQFLGVELKLPPHKKRTTDWSAHKMRDQLQKTYASLARKIQAAPAFKVWQPAGL
jgi:hypothetical protein